MFQIIELLCIACCFIITTADAHPGRNFQQSLTQQNIQSILMSIEQRLANLDNVYAASRRSWNVEEKIQSSVTRLENLQYKIDRFESMISAQFHKITENITYQYFRQDNARDRLLRKIDDLCETVNHKLITLETKIEQGERAMKDKLDEIWKKFERMEDSLTTRSEDIEGEIGEVLVTLEEIRKPQKAKTNSEFQQTIEDLIPKLEGTIELVNETMREHKRHANCADARCVENWKSLEVLVNRTRNEQQNSFRNLIVQVGRLEGKNNILCDHSGDSSQQLTNLTNKLDTSFDNVINLQNLFLDSCQRIQADEPQLEAKIGELLEKMIDIFEKSQSAVEDSTNKDHLIRTHDGSVQRILHTISYNLEGLLRRVKDHDEIAQLLHSIQSGLEDLTKGLSSDTVFRNETLRLLRELRGASRIDDTKSQVQELFDKIRKVADVFSSNTSKTLGGSIDKGDIKLIRDDLSEINGKVDGINTKMEKFGKEANVRPDTESDLDKAIREVFGIPNEKSTNFTDPANGSLDRKKNCTDGFGLLDVRMKCNDCDHDADNNCTSKTQDEIVFRNETDDNCSNCAHEIKDIDVRSNGNNTGFQSNSTNIIEPAFLQSFSQQINETGSLLTTNPAP